MLIIYWVDITSNAHFVHFLDFTTFTAKIVINHLSITVLSLLEIFADISTFPNVDLHLEFSTFKDHKHGSTGYPHRRLWLQGYHSA